jgi:hypothetical protein
MADMLNTLIPLTSATATVVTYWVLGFFVDEVGMGLAASTVEKAIGSFTVGAILFFLLRWALKRNDNLADQITALQKERDAMHKAHFEEIKTILKGKT